ncbi:MAG: ABC transporter permease subunit [Phycisphaerales bacterium]
MNRGIVLKSARELLPATLLLGAAMAILQAILAYVLPTFAQQIVGNIMQIRFAQTFIEALIGAKVAPDMDAATFGTIAWTHPVALALLWAHAAIATTRVPAGEVDRGTIDVLFGLPVSRVGAYASDTLAWGAAGTVLIAAALAGHFIGSRWLPEGLRPDWARVVIVLVNMLAMYLAVGGLGALCSSFSDRRGWAIGLIFALVVTSFLVNYLAQLWEPARRFEYLSVLRYYRPLLTMRDGAWPLGGIAVLLAIGAAFWAAGAAIFARRDLTTT